MSLLGKIKNSLLSATNENTIALANLNFDFALINFKAPVEFEPLGEALSVQRRNDAEEGDIHKTARRLGALFQSIIPATPRLIKAYGHRVSEIISLPGINPKGSKKDGPFEAFVGVDGTSIWAAATSDRADSSAHAPLAVHLLACMLARAWDAQEATAIWVELVIGRQKEIEEIFKADQIASPAIIAACQKISRKQLALWDASARSWLRSADDAKVSEQTKLMLILKNINVPISVGSSTYSKVLAAWRQAMAGMEDLIGGMPQQVSNGSVLLALSAWHLFPDLVVLGRQINNVRFKDSLISSGGIITIGLQAVDSSEDESVRWSLALSHLRYYGDSVNVRSDNMTSRATMQQLHIAVFGGLMANWKVPPKNMVDAAKWFVALWEFMTNSLPNEERESLVQIFDWLYVLVKAATYVLENQATEFETCEMLLKWGRRRAKCFLEDEPSSQRPFFGLCNPRNLSALTEKSETECAIRYLREYAQGNGLQSGDAIVSFRYVERDICYHEFATAIPHEKATNKRSHDGKPILEKCHSRWLFAFHSTKDSKVALPHSIASVNLISCSGQNYNTLLCLCRQDGGVCSTECRPRKHRDLLSIPFNLDPRRAELATRGEQYHLVSDRDINLCKKASPTELNTRPHEPENSWDSPEERFMWSQPASAYHNHDNINLSPGACRSITEFGGQCQCFESCFRFTQSIHQVQFKLVIGHGKFSLYVIDKPQSQGYETTSLQVSEPGNIYDTQEYPCTASRWFVDKLIDKAEIITYCKALSDSRIKPSFPGKAFVARASKSLPSFDFLESLKGLGVVSDIYSTLIGATVSLEVLSTPFFKSSCIPSSNYHIQHAIKGKVAQQIMATTPELGITLEKFVKSDLSNGELFSCIAYFESGCHDIKPSDLGTVMALASGNSIFVAGVLHVDPFDRGYCKRIIGNVGHAGMTMMVAPQDPRIRSLSDDYTLVNHVDYDSKREDNFQGTSLHLSFTNWKLPLDTGAKGTIDQDIHLVESVVSVHDRGMWVADLDPLKVPPSREDGYIFCAQTAGASQSHVMIVKCDHPELHNQASADDFTSIDSWEELLDPPENVGIFRAHKNWAARLAATSILLQREDFHEEIFILDPDSNTCLTCLKSKLNIRFVID